MAATGSSTGIFLGSTRLPLRGREASRREPIGDLLKEILCAMIIQHNSNNCTPNKALIFVSFQIDICYGIPLLVFAARKAGRLIANAKNKLMLRNMSAVNPFFLPSELGLQVHVVATHAYALELYFETLGCFHEVMQEQAAQSRDLR